MEKQKLQNKFSESNYSNNTVWDCGSTLYDSFELNSFKHQLDSAIVNSQILRRTLSMSHLPERRVTVLPQSSSSSSSSSSSVMSRKPYKLSRSFQKFIRSVFKSSNKKSNVSSSIIGTGTSSNNSFKVQEKYSKERFYVVYDKSGPVLSTIPEVPEFEFGSLSPDISSLIIRSASERFTSTTIGIACI